MQFTKSFCQIVFVVPCHTAKPSFQLQLNLKSAYIGLKKISSDSLHCLTLQSTLPTDQYTCLPKFSFQILIHKHLCAHAEYIRSPVLSELGIRITRTRLICLKLDFALHGGVLADQSVAVSVLISILVGLEEAISCRSIISSLVRFRHEIKSPWCSAVFARGLIHMKKSWTNLTFHLHTFDNSILICFEILV